jgi:hypothetical protein
MRPGECRGLRDFALTFPENWVNGVAVNAIVFYRPQAGAVSEQPNPVWPASR